MMMSDPTSDSSDAGGSSSNHQRKISKTTEVNETSKNNADSNKQVNIFH